MNRWTRRSAATSRSVLTALVVAGGLALAGCAAGQEAQTAEQRPTVDGQNASLGPLDLRDVALEYPAAGLYRQGGDARLRMVVVNDSGDADALVGIRTDAAQEVTITEAATGGTGSTTPTPAGTSAEPSSTPTGTASGTPTGTREPASPSATVGPGEPSDDPDATESGSSESPAPSAPGSGRATATPSGGARPLTSVPLPPNGLVQFRDDGPVITLAGLTRQLRPSEALQVTFVFQNAGELTLRIAVGAPEGEISLAPTVTSAEDSNEG